MRGVRHRADISSAWLRGPGEGQSDEEGQRLPYDAVRALSQLLGDGVPVVDDEVLVKDLEDLASLEVGHGGRFEARGERVRKAKLVRGKL